MVVSSAEIFLLLIIGRLEFERGLTVKARFNLDEWYLTVYAEYLFNADTITSTERVDNEV
jgi:hypothetical protein